MKTETAINNSVVFTECLWQHDKFWVEFTVWHVHREECKSFLFQFSSVIWTFTTQYYKTTVPRITSLPFASFSWKHPLSKHKNLSTQALMCLLEVPKYPRLPLLYTPHPVALPLNCISCCTSVVASITILRPAISSNHVHFDCQLYVCTVSKTSRKIHEQALQIGSSDAYKSISTLEKINISEHVICTHLYLIKIRWKWKRTVLLPLEINPLKLTPIFVFIFMLTLTAECVYCHVASVHSLSMRSAWFI